MGATGKALHRRLLHRPPKGYRDRASRPRPYAERGAGLPPPLDPGDIHLLERVKERRAIADALRAVSEGDGPRRNHRGAGRGRQDRPAGDAGRQRPGTRGDGGDRARLGDRAGVRLRRRSCSCSARWSRAIATRPSSMAPRRWPGPCSSVPGSAPAPMLEFQLLHGLYWLCANLCERAPLVLCVDDVQWADAASLRFLAYLGARAADLPVLIGLSRRSGEPGELAALEELRELPIATALSAVRADRGGRRPDRRRAAGGEGGGRAERGDLRTQRRQPAVRRRAAAGSRRGRRGTRRQPAARRWSTSSSGGSSGCRRRRGRSPRRWRCSATRRPRPRSRSSPTSRPNRPCWAWTGSPRPSSPIPRTRGGSVTRSCARR